MDQSNAVQIVFVTRESARHLRKRLRSVCTAGWQVRRLWRFGLPVPRRLLVTLARPEDLGHVLGHAA